MRSQQTQGSQRIAGVPFLTLFHEEPIKFCPKLGDRLVISPGKSLSGSPVSLNLAGFRRLNAPAFLTIN